MRAWQCVSDSELSTDADKSGQSTDLIARNGPDDRPYAKRDTDYTLRCIAERVDADDNSRAVSARIDVDQSNLH
jgi:hypothetical protein